MYGLCCCCLELPCLKSLWTEYVWMGHNEVYGDMLKECFNINWPQYENSKDQICEVCITQLRSAMQFKQKVFTSKTRLEAKLEEITAKSNHVYENYTNVIVNNDDVDEGNEHNDDTEYKNVFDEENDLKCAKREVTEQTSNNYCNEIPPQNTENRKKEKRKPNNTKKDNKTRKRRVIVIQPEKKRDKIEFKKVNYIQPRQNVCSILENSTIVPFKSTQGYFNCLYCNKQHLGFDELKIHMTQFHENINFKTILKSIHRPHDRVKADVSNISCRICQKGIDDLDMLVSHLTDEHNVKFNSDTKPANCILPYDLSDGKYKCYVCKSEFLFFKTLSSHMNSHSSDYVCDVCGRCFLLPERLRAHVHMHVDSKAVKCEVCGKVCGSSILLRSHVRYAHKKLSFMCSICNETFSTYKLRMRHWEEVHKRIPMNLSCKICCKNYSTPNSLNSHMRKYHFKITNEPKHNCTVCGMMFRSPNALACHSVVHSEVKKFQCEVCHKKYARAKSLTEHLKIHRNDKRWSCGACSQAFVQKCSLKNHIRVHHVNVDCEQLIVYKKPDVE